MLPKERRALILEQLNENEKIDIEHIANQLQVSTMTIRRDLSYLEEKEKVIRTHGGAVLNKPLVNETSFLIKESKNSVQKQQIAQIAASLVPDHSTILLDSGTTTIEIAKLLIEKQNVTVITNDVYIASVLINSPVKVIITGGELQNNVGAIFGSLTESLLKSIHVDICFLGAHAFHSEAGITAPTFEKAAIKKLMIAAAETTYLVADSSKANEKSTVKVCDFSEINGGLITDYLDEQLKAQLCEKITIIS